MWPVSGGFGRQLPYVRLVVAVVIGWLVAMLVPLGSEADLVVRVLTGFVVATIAFNLPVLWAISRFDAEQTKRWVSDLSPGRRLVDVLVLLAGFASLAAVATMFLGGGAKSDSERVLESALALAVIAMAWISVHMNYTLRYAKHYYAEDPQAIDFGDEPPQLSDFAYLAFTLGMTYQVSDTALRSSQVRSMVLAHTLISYVFGAVIIAASINLLAGLAK